MYTNSKRSFFSKYIQYGETLCAVWSCGRYRGCHRTQVITIPNPTHNIDQYNKYVVTFPFRFPNDLPRRLRWVEFVVNNGHVANMNSKLCSRHFVPGVDYSVENVRRRRLVHTAVPSLVCMIEVFQEQPY